MQLNGFGPSVHLYDRKCFVSQVPRAGSTSSSRTSQNYFPTNDRVTFITPIKLKRAMLAYNFSPAHSIIRTIPSLFVPRSYLIGFALSSLPHARKTKLISSTCASALGAGWSNSPYLYVFYSIPYIYKFIVIIISLFSIH